MPNEFSSVELVNSMIEHVEHLTKFGQFSMENSKIKNSFSIENILAKKTIVRNAEGCDFVNNHTSDRELFENKISACDENYHLDKNFSMPDSSCTEDTSELCSDEASEGSNCKKNVWMFLSLKITKLIQKVYLTKFTDHKNKL